MGRKPRSTRRVGALCCFVVIALAGTLFSLGYAISSRREFRESTAALADAAVAKWSDDDAGREALPVAPKNLRGDASRANSSVRVPTFWSPIEISSVEHGDPRVTLCKLDMDSYWRAPAKTPMFRDLVAASRCGRGKSGSLNALVAELAEKGVTPVEPSGFVFHESRVGSTLVANMLASVPHHLVYSESAPPPIVINHCRSCTPERRTDLIRKLFALMGASTSHTKLFFKFQSITVPNIIELSRAFPKTPWIFVYREPVQVMMSHFKHGGRSAPCLRDKAHPRETTARILGKSVRDAGKVSSEDFCAAHLTMLCESALEMDAQRDSRGLMVDYDSLPGALVGYVMPTHFGAELSSEDAGRMIATSQVYSKARTSSTTSSKAVWTADSAAKEAASTEAVRAAAAKLMRPRYDKLLAATLAKTGGDDLSRFKSLGRTAR